MKTQTFQDINIATRLEALAWMTGIIGLTTLSVLPFQNSIRIKLVLSAEVLALGVASRIASKGSFMMGSRLDDVRDVSDQMHTQELAATMFKPFNTTPVLPAEVDVHTKWKPSLFTIEDLIKEKGKYPHVLILGSTGSGKSLLAEYLVDLDKDTVRTFVSPCHDDSEFIDYSTVGTGFNYAQIEAFMQSLVSEMEERYSLDIGEVMSRYGYRNVVIDEGTNTAKNSDTFTQSLLTLIGMARKRFIRIWLCTTAQNVKSLNMEGEGESRSNFTYVRLGDEGKEHIHTLVNRGELSQKDEDWYNQQLRDGKRMAMINSSMCVLPDLSGYIERKLLGGATRPTQSFTVQPVVDSRFDEAYNLFDEGYSKTKISETFGLRGDKRKKFWENYDAWLLTTNQEPPAL